MSQPVAVSSAICCRVALTSAVGVVHIDCTETGASPPTSTVPTLILRDLRRGETTGGGKGGIPRETDMGSVSLTGRGPSRSAEHGAHQPSLIGLTTSAYISRTDMPISRMDTT